IPSLRAARDTLEAVRAGKTPRAQIVKGLNRCETGVVGGIARRPYVKSILRGEQVVFIREDARTARGRANARLPPGRNSPGSRLSKDIAQLTTLIAALQPALRESSVGTRPQAA